MSIVTKDQNRLQECEIDPKKELLKKTICKGASDDEFELFGHICKHTGLDPFLRQIYPVFRNERQPDGTWRPKMTVQTSIDGFRLIAERTGNYSPGKEPTFYYDNGKLVSATAYVKKRTADGTWHDVAATAFYDEYVQRGKDGKAGQFWERMPHVMVAKCAEALALRKAFPAELSGLYTQDEMNQASAIPEDKLEKAELSEGQCAILDSLLAEVDDDEYLKKLAEYLNVGSIYDMNPRDFTRTVKSIEKKLNKKEEDDGSTNVA